MSDTSTGPLLKPDDRVHFVDSHRPPLPDGDYTITLTHHIGEQKISASQSLDFALKGPRFAVENPHIASRFPPQDADGDFGAVLPHIILERSTLPWERSAVVGTDPDSPPWLALLVLAEDELVGRTQIVKSSALMTDAVDAEPPDPAFGDSFVLLSRGATDAVDTPVLTIELDATDAKNLLPTLHELRLLNSVRQVNDQPGKAIVIANRLPKPDARNQVHLVSLEHQFNQNGSHWSETAQSNRVRLVSLTHWTFHCDTSPGDLATVLKDLGIGTYALDMENAGSSAWRVAQGNVPVEHVLEDGRRTAAWFHGPLAAAQRAFPEFPVRRPEDLLLVDPGSGMVDVSYAAAWKQGQLQALSNPRVSQALHNWKRAVAHARRMEDQKSEFPEHAPDPRSRPDFPVAEWYDSAFKRMGGVPFTHLVPDPALLPPETLVFFETDVDWIAALFDGALSLGRTSVRELEHDRELWRELPEINPTSGVLIRSRAVAGWPDLLVDGYLPGLPAGNGSARAETLRFERLGDDVLLVLFDGLIARVEVHLHPQAIHFGFDRDQEVFFKNSRRVVNVSDLASRISADSAHRFSFAMVEAAPRVVFEV